MDQPSTLLCHPASPCDAISALHVTTHVQADGGLQLSYELRGELDALSIPVQQTVSHTPLNTMDLLSDELWLHTCFEAFIATPESPTYREFNFSPSGHWAAYAFIDCRQRDTSWRPAQGPRIATTTAHDSLLLEVYIPPVLLPAITKTSVTPNTLLISLTAVIEASDSTLSYWALTHTAERPDFHQRAAFTLELVYDPYLASHTDQQ